jgi:type I pantothenate kinase
MSSDLMKVEDFQRYREFTRADWALLHSATLLPLSEPQLRPLIGLNERLSLDEVSDVYLPLSQFLNLHVTATQKLCKTTANFLGTESVKVPYVIGISGSVAVGKSTISRILQALLSRWPSHPRVDLITTDGFLLPLAALEARSLLDRKGFPESYDMRRLVKFMIDIKSGLSKVETPVYSHLAYDILPGKVQTVQQPEILIVEGLNLLQKGDSHSDRPIRTFVSDFLDFSIYVDAIEEDIEQWYIERFVALRETVFRDPSSYFHKYADLSKDESIVMARRIWHAINRENLRKNILPTREHADLILEKGRDHAVRVIKLKRM